MIEAKQSPIPGRLFLLFTLLGILVSASIAVTLFALPGGVDPTLDPTGPSLEKWAAISFLILAILGIPALYSAIRALQGRTIQFPSVSLPGVILMLLVYAASLALGYFAFTAEFIPSIVVPVVQFFAVIIPAALTILIARRMGPPLSLRQFWAQLLAGLWVAPPIALVAEAVLLLPTLLIFGIGASLSPQGKKFLDLLQQSAYPSLESLTQSVEDLILEPWVILIALGYVAVLVPLIEEALKTIAIWPFIPRKPSPRAAFIGGVIGGTGYAIFEALFLSQAGEVWIQAIVSRAGATAMHAFASGVASWGLAQGLVRKRWGQMLVGYFAAVMMHGLWNASAIGIGLGTYSFLTAEVENPALVGVATIGATVILGLLLTAVLGLFRIPGRLKSDEQVKDVVAMNQVGPGANSI
jgi:hypothetical protein